RRGRICGGGGVVGAGRPRRMSGPWAAKRPTTLGTGPPGGGDKPRPYVSAKLAAQALRRLYRARAFSMSGKFSPAQSQTDLKIGWRLRPSVVTEYSTRGGISG